MRTLSAADRARIRTELAVLAWERIVNQSDDRDVKPENVRVAPAQRHVGEVKP